MNLIFVGRFTDVRICKQKVHESFGVSGVSTGFDGNLHDERLRRLALLAHFRELAEKMQRRVRSKLWFQKRQRMTKRSGSRDDFQKRFQILVGKVNDRFPRRHG